MRIEQHEILRIRGTLTLELADGQEGSMEVNVDVSGPATMGIENIYEDADRFPPTVRMPTIYAQRHWFEVPVRLATADPVYTLTLPTDPPIVAPCSRAKEHEWIYVYAEDSVSGVAFQFCRKCDREEYSDGSTRPGVL